MEDKDLLTLLIVFFLGCFAYQMMRNMCGGRLVEGSFFSVKDDFISATNVYQDCGEPPYGQSPPTWNAWVHCNNQRLCECDADTSRRDKDGNPFEKIEGAKCNYLESCRGSNNPGGYGPHSPEAEWVAACSAASYALCMDEWRR